MKESAVVELLPARERGRCVLRCGLENELTFAIPRTANEFTTVGRLIRRLVGNEATRVSLLVSPVLAGTAWERIAWSEGAPAVSDRTLPLTFLVGGVEPQPAQPLPSSVRLLAIVEAGTGEDAFDVDDATSFLSSSAISPTVLVSPTTSELAKTLREQTFDAIHVIAHGTSGPSAMLRVGKGMDATEFGGLIRGHAPIVFLACCHLGDSTERGAFAERLVAVAQLRACVAASHAFNVRNAHLVAREFYPRLVAGDEPGRALAEAMAHVADTPESLRVFVSTPASTFLHVQARGRAIPVFAVLVCLLSLLALWKCRGDSEQPKPAAEIQATPANVATLEDVGVDAADVVDADAGSDTAEPDAARSDTAEVDTAEVDTARTADENSRTARSRRRLKRQRPDRDGDGVPDEEDRCVDRPGLLTRRGCPR